MSDTENKTENNAETKAENAPYMKKDSDKKSADKTSSKSNLVIPLILLLVSTIVIVATFYDDKYNKLMAQHTPVADTTETAASASPDNAQNPEVTIAKTEAATTETAATETAIADEQTATAVSEAPEVNSVALAQADGASSKTSVATATQTVSTANRLHAMQPDNSVVGIKAAATKNHSRMQPMHAPYQRNPYANRQVWEQARQEAVARSWAHAQERAKKHDEIMQQHRQAYEKEMQARRQRNEAAREAAMKTQQERRAKIAETQKAVFQRIEQNRIENRQKIEEMHKRISEMHEEIHQMMRDSHTHHKSSAPAQIQSPSIEQM